MCCTQAYKPRIRFPPRYTTDGRRISSLPADEAARALAELEAGDGAAASTAPSPEEQSQQSEQVCCSCSRLQPCAACASCSYPVQPCSLAAHCQSWYLRCVATNVHDTTLGTAIKRYHRSSVSCDIGLRYDVRSRRCADHCQLSCAGSASFERGQRCVEETAGAPARPGQQQAGTPVAGRAGNGDDRARRGAALILSEVATCDVVSVPGSGSSEAVRRASS